MYYESCDKKKTAEKLRKKNVKSKLDDSNEYGFNKDLS